MSILKHVKRIIKLQNLLATKKELTEKEKEKYTKELDKLQKRFLLASRFHTDEKEYQMFITDWGTRVLVCDNKIVYKKNTLSSMKNNQTYSFLLAFMILIILYIIVAFLEAFGIVPKNLVMSFSFVLGIAGIALNVWTIISCWKTLKTFRWLLLLNGFAIFMNGFNVVGDLGYFFG